MILLYYYENRGKYVVKILRFWSALGFKLIVSKGIHIPNSKQILMHVHEIFHGRAQQQQKENAISWTKNKENQYFRANNCKRRYTRQISCNHIIIQLFHHHDESLAVWTLFDALPIRFLLWGYTPGGVWHRGTTWLTIVFGKIDEWRILDNMADCASDPLNAGNEFSE